MRKDVVLFCLVLFGVAHLYAQEAEDLLVDSVPLENAITSSDLAVRIRSEILFTDDDDDIIDDDIAFKRFPSTLYDTEIKVSQANRLSFSGEYSFWENKQDLRYTRWGWTIRAPITKNWMGFIRNRYRLIRDEDDKTYIYTGASGMIGKKLYAMTSYRYASTQGSGAEHKLSQYLSYAAHKRVVIGGTADASHTHDQDDEILPWSLSAFTAIMLAPDNVSLRLFGMHYESTGDFAYDEYRAYVYKTLGEKTTARIGYRIYSDNRDLSSDSFDLKIKHFFSASAAVHGGYRFYDHNSGLDYDSFFAGCSLLFP